MIGIYAIWFEEPSLIYIGQSSCIEKRLVDHKGRLKANKHKNYKLQNAYNKYNNPEYTILSLTKLKNLDIEEISWIEEFNSVKEGLNIVAGGESAGRGTEASGSIYSKARILRVFSLLYNTKLSSERISLKTNVSKDVVDKLRQGSIHLWLKEMYPEQYVKVYSKRKYCIKVLNKYQESFSITNISSFAKDYYIEESLEAERLRQGLTLLKNGKTNSYKGWVLDN